MTIAENRRAWIAEHKCKATTGHAVGDLMLIPVKGRWVLGEVTEAGRPDQDVVAWGDMWKQVPDYSGLVIYRRNCKQSMGQYIGSSFATLQEAAGVLGPHRLTIRDI